MVKSNKKLAKKNKGFTLVELLAVIVVLAIILAIAIPSIFNTLNKAKQDVYLRNEDMMRNVAKKYTTIYLDSLPTNVGATERVTLSMLIESNMIEEIRDPKNSSIICDGYVDVTNINNKDYTYTPYLTCGTNYSTATSDLILQQLNSFGYGYFYSVTIDNDGNFIAVGYSDGDMSIFGGNLGAGHDDFVIAKFDSNLNLLLLNNLGGTLEDCFNSVAVDNSGNYVAAGYSKSNLSLLSGGTTNAAGNDFVVAKFDSNLNLIKIKNFGVNSWDRFKSIVIDSQNNYIAAGDSNSNLSSFSGGAVNSGDTDFVVAKFDSNLNLIKIKNFGGTKWDSLNSIVIDSQNNYIAAGDSQSDLTSIGGTPYTMYYDFVVAKFDSNLNLITFNNFSGDDDDWFYSIIVDSSGNYIAVGSTWSDLSSFPGGSTHTGDVEDFVIAKFDSNLNLIKIKNFGGDNDEYFYSVAADSKGNYIAVGYSASDLSMFPGGSSDDQTYLVIAKFDVNLNLITIKDFGGTRTSIFYSVAVDSLDNYIAVGNTSGDLSSFGGMPNTWYDYFVIAKLK